MQFVVLLCGEPAYGCLYNSSHWSVAQKSKNAHTDSKYLFKNSIQQGDWCITVDKMTGTSCRPKRSPFPERSRSGPVIQDLAKIRISHAPYQFCDSGYTISKGLLHGQKNSVNCTPSSRFFYSGLIFGRVLWIYYYWLNYVNINMNSSSFGLISFNWKKYVGRRSFQSIAPCTKKKRIPSAWTFYIGTCYNRTYASVNRRLLCKYFIYFMSYQFNFFYYSILYHF